MVNQQLKQLVGCPRSFILPVYLTIHTRCIGFALVLDRPILTHMDYIYLNHILNYTHLSCKVRLPLLSTMSSPSTSTSHHGPGAYLIHNPKLYNISRKPLLSPILCVSPNLAQLSIIEHVVQSFSNTYHRLSRIESHTSCTKVCIAKFSLRKGQIEEHFHLL